MKAAEYEYQSEDFGSFLEWLDYQYEAFLVSKQLDELSEQIQSFRESDL